MREESKLYDFGGYPEISAYAVADVHFYGTDCRVIMFDWFLNDGVWQRRIVATVKRPICTAHQDFLDRFRRPENTGPKEVGNLAMH